MNLNNNKCYERLQNEIKSISQALQIEEQDEPMKHEIISWSI